MPAFSITPKIKWLTPFVLLASAFMLVQPRPISPQNPFPEKGRANPGIELLEKGDYEQAITYFNNRLALPTMGNKDKLECYRSLSILYWYSDRGPEAAQSCRKAREIASALGLRALSSSIGTEIALQESCAQAEALKDGGDLPGSNLNFEKAWLMAHSIGSRAHEIKILRMWSVNYLRLPGAKNKCLDLNVQSLAIALSLNHLGEAGAAANNIGSYYHINNDYSHALSYYLRALYYVQDRSPSNDAIVCMNNIASVYNSLGDYTKAYDYLSDAMKFIDRVPAVPSQFRPLINLGQTFLLLARSSHTPEYYQWALECFTSYLNLKKKAGGEGLTLHALVGISSIHIDRGEFNEARAILIPALKKARTDSEADLSGMILLNLAAIALKSHRISEAEGYFEEARAAAGQSSNLLLMIRATCGFGRCSVLRGQIGQAIISYNEAVRIITNGGSGIVKDTDRAEFISRSREPYQALIDLYSRLSEENPIRMFENEIYRLSENSRTRPFLEYLERQAQPLDSRPPAPETGVPGQDSLNSERLGLLKALSQGVKNQKESEALQARLKHIDDMLDSLLSDDRLRNNAGTTNTASVSLNRLQNSVLTENVAVIEYFLGDERSFLIFISKDSFHIVKLPGAETISESLTGYLSFLEDPSISASKGLPAAQRLYGELFSPIEKFIPGSVDHLIIVPDGILFRLPFETLAPRATGSSAAGSLIDRYVISYSPSASALFYLKARPKTSYTKEALAFGISEYPGPVQSSKTADVYSARSVLDELYKRNGFVMGPIPHARGEIAGLGKRIRADRVDLYFGTNATEKTFKSLDLAAYRIVHLACHAFSDDHYPLRSSLVFSRGSDDDEDGFLQVSEMYKMKMNAELVVLSACQTGRGKIVINEGILGLPRVFFYMGARSVISTLWPINDKASAIFMDYFYDSYFQGGEKAKALQVAKQKMAHTRYGHPYYWASFTLTGEY